MQSCVIIPIKKTFLGKNVADGKIFDVALQFYKLREWRIHLEYDSEAVCFVKKENCELEEYFAGHRGSSPLDVVNEFYEYAKSLIDDGFVCVTYSDIEKM